MSNPIPVWEYIEAELAERGWDRNELAYRMGGTEAQMQRNLCALDILDHCRLSRIPLNQETADRLAAAFGTSSTLWLNIDKSCKAALAAREVGNG